MTESQAQMWQVIGLASLTIFLTILGASYERERLRAQRRIVEMQQRLVALARKAGQAEVASDVLHQVGNTLNGVMTSAAMLERHLQHGRRNKMARLAELLEEGAVAGSGDDSTERKRQLAARYARSLADRQAELFEQLTRELQRLQHFTREAERAVSAQERFAHRALEGYASFIVDEALQEAIDAAAPEARHQATRICPPELELSADRPCVVEIVTAMIRAVDRWRGEAGAAEPTGLDARAEAASVVITATGHGCKERKHDASLFADEMGGSGSQRSQRSLHWAANAARRLGGRLEVDPEAPADALVLRLCLPRTAA
ncbi:MAG TPA: hypothetical protein ENK57_05670 [Polyangiaceae bacterium]|nr:hypothetical protein [Polyangiaceae bacterium]